MMVPKQPNPAFFAPQPASNAFNKFFIIVKINATKLMLFYFELQYFSKKIAIHISTH